MSLDLEWHIETEHDTTSIDIPVVPAPDNIGCDQCTFVAVDVQALVLHIRNDHTEEHCKYCEYVANDRDSLKEHMFKNHEEVVMVHTMAQHVNDISESFAHFETFKGEQTGVLNQIFDNLNSLKANQNTMKQDLFLVRNKEAEDAKKKKSDKFPEPSTLPSLEAGHEAAPPVPKQAAQEPRTATSSSPPTSGQCGPPKPRPQHYKKKKTSYMNKPKVLYIGDSIAHNADFAHIEKESKTRIRTVKAYSSVNDRRAKWPKKNCTDVTQKALLNTREDDEFSHLVVAAPSVDISNIDASKVTVNDNVEVYKQHVVHLVKTYLQ